MAKFKVGDRVKIVRNDYLNCEIGDTGTIMAYNSGASYAVEFDIPRPSYHGCRGLTTPGHGQWALEENIELIEPIKDKPTREFKLIITSSGDTTTAKLIHGERTVVKEATVTRYSKDEYSEKAAVEAVVKKIFGEDEKKNEANKPYTGKAVWICDNESVYTKGKIYEFVDGKFKHDLGFTVVGYTLEKNETARLLSPDSGMMEDE
nr:MAG TPA: SH3-like domain protein [Bacteriophage sp.]